VAHSRFWSVPGALKNAVEACIQTESGLFTDTGEVTDENGAHFLRDYMAEFREFIVRVLTVLPRQA
jgi:chromate reductase